MSGVLSVIEKLNQKLVKYTPLTIACYSWAILIIYLRLRRWWLRLRRNDSLRDVAGRLALKLPVVRTAFKKQIVATVKGEVDKVIAKWKKFGDPIIELPEHGWTKEALLGLIDKYTTITNPQLADHYMSGTVYSYSLRDSEAIKSENIAKIGELDEKREIKTKDDYISLSKLLKEVYAHAFTHSYLWNSLHGNEFGVGDYISYQVVRMVANMYGGQKDDVMGFVTSGGTESLMVATRIYRNWGVANHGHLPGESVIICPYSIHAAVMKGGEAYNIQVILTPTDKYGVVDYEELQRVAYKHRNQLVAIFVSAPSYPIGVVDDVKRVAKLAQELRVGLHVDSCLGGFIVNNLDHHDTNYLSIPGVTSLSVDTHKNGWAPKGSSVLVTRPLYDDVFGSVNIAYYSIYAIPGWSGGVYGSPKDPGSQGVTNALHAFLALLAIGKKGYRSLAYDIHNTAIAMGKIVDETKELELLGTPQVNVVAWKARDGIWAPGAIYAFAHEMETHGIVINTLCGDKVHYCVTGRTAGDDVFLQKFKEAVQKAVIKVNGYNEDVKSGKSKFPGNAGLYGTLEAAMSPAASKMSRAEYFQNMLLGNRGAADGVRGYFMALLNPHNKFA